MDHDASKPEVIVGPKISTFDDVLRACDRVIRKIESGHLDHRQGDTIARLLAVAVRAVHARTVLGGRRRVIRSEMDRAEVDARIRQVYGLPPGGIERVKNEN